jgi:hypothetical protein
MSRLLVLLALTTVTAACASPGPARPDAAARTTLEHQAQADLAAYARAVVHPAVGPTAGVDVPPPSTGGIGLSVESFTASPVGRTSTVTFVGAPHPASEPCGADYTATAIESSHAVVVVVDEHVAPGDQACSSVGASRTTTAADCAAGRSRRSRGPAGNARTRDEELAARLRADLVEGVCGRAAPPPVCCLGAWLGSAPPGRALTGQ